MLTLSCLQLRPTIMLNSSNCNLRCAYCYCEPSRATKNRLMDADTAAITIKKFVHAYPDFISFCWHGGEPLYKRTIDFYEKLIEFEECFRLKNQKIENRIQTNGTLIIRPWAKFFKTHDFRVGISIDGPQWLNDFQRLTLIGKGTFNEIKQGINFLQEEDIQFSVIMVITNQSARFPAEIYDFIVREGFTTVNLNPCFDNQFAVDSIDYAHFMNRIFDLWMTDDRDSLTFGFFEDVIRWFRGGNPTVCHLRNSCFRHVKIDWNGDVLPCDDFLGPEFVFGNILKQNLAEIITEKNYRDFYRLSTRQVPECKSCKWANLCHGGCSRYSLGQNFSKHLNTMCEGRKMIFSHIEEVLRVKNAQSD